MISQVGRAGHQHDPRLGPALSAELATIVTVSDYTGRDDFTGAQAVLSDLGDDDAPARSVRGPAPDNGMVDVAFLRRVLAADR